MLGFMRKLLIEELGRKSIEQYASSEKLPLTVVLDNVRSIYNVGSVFRTADALLIEKVVLCGITACPPSDEIHKTALGAELSVPWIYEEDTLEAVNKLKEEGYQVLAAEQVEGSIALQDYSYVDGKIAIVFGHEVKGVRQDVVDICHGALEIPQFGTKHSLNVSVSAGIVMWEVVKQMMFK